jgi:hypothetical protein
MLNNIFAVYSARLASGIGNTGIEHSTVLISNFIGASPLSIARLTKPGAGACAVQRVSF